VVLLLPHLNPAAQGTASTDPPGNVVVEVRWPDAIDADVDLWIQAPDDVPVGYANLGGAVFNLLRDDRGHFEDRSNLNYEMAYSRDIPAGEYTVNLHLYDRDETDGAIPVEVAVGIKGPAQSRLDYIVRKHVSLAHLDEELTVARFELTEEGRLVPGSFNQLPQRLRNVPRTQ
jgi:hypothetical protein